MKNMMSNLEPGQINDHLPVLQPKPLKRILFVVGVIANLLTVILAIASFIHRDPLLLATALLIIVALALCLYWLFKTRIIDHQNILTLGAYCLGSAFVALFSWTILTNITIRPIQVNIAEPQDGEKINGDRYLVKGTVSDPNANVYVVIRPLETSEIFNQELTTVDRLGNWQVNAHFGYKSLGHGERFEVIALAVDENILVSWATGNLLDVGKITNLPRKTNRSVLLTVTRVE